MAMGDCASFPGDCGRLWVVMGGYGWFWVVMGDCG